MKVIKRNGTEVPFDYTKIKSAIEAANACVAEKDRLSDTMVGFIVGNVEKRCDALGRAVSVEEIQDIGWGSGHQVQLQAAAVFEVRGDRADDYGRRVYLQSDTVYGFSCSSFQVPKLGGWREHHHQRCDHLHPEAGNG